MPIYVYETIPAATDEAPRTYEIEQRMAAAPLRRHPQTGERIRRVITADRGITGFAVPRCGTDCGTPGSGGGCCCAGGD
jgi:predicted nucleic acid-binding Zn ribbon protein